VGPEVRVLRGFRDELRDLLMRAVERGLGPADLVELGRRRGRPDWVSAAEVLDEYVEVTSLATPGAYEPAGIVDAAANLLTVDPALLAAERERWSLVVVDDAHEVTAATQRLLEVLVGEGGDVVLAGDPDSATQTFRGARPSFLGSAASSWPRARSTGRGRCCAPSRPGSRSGSARPALPCNARRSPPPAHPRAPWPRTSSPRRRPRPRSWRTPCARRTSPATWAGARWR
jgi:hypothetical protein